MQFLVFNDKSVKIGCRLLEITENSKKQVAINRKKCPDKSGNIRDQVSIETINKQ